MEDENGREGKQVKSVHEHQLVLSTEEERNNDGTQVWCCKGCAQPIPGPHYCCKECDFFLHKPCAELPLEIKHPAHPERHKLLRFQAKPPQRYGNFKCHFCSQDWQSFTYRCFGCGFSLDFQCALAALLPPYITFGDHRHAFTLWVKTALFSCDACGTTHDKGFSYLCTECQFWVHQDCASLPNTIKHNAHIHPLTLTCYYPRDDDKFRLPFCEICSGDAKSERLLYGCVGCRFSAHVNCANSDTQDDKFETESEHQVTIHPTHLPVQDISIDFVSQFFEKISLGENQSAMEIKHFSHDHPLTICDHREQVSTSSNEDPRCQACTRPISDPFYSCTKCNYFMHKSCSELPTEIKHPFHPDHTLVLVNKASFFYNMFICTACEKFSNGFAYHCTSCNFDLDLICSSFSRAVVHEAHEHPLVGRRAYDTYCRACHELCQSFVFGCVTCGFNLHIKCALLPRTVRHRRDEHPLTLSCCLSINHYEEYICDTCEKDVLPYSWFYFCAECDDPLHPECISSFNRDSNILFGDKVDFGGHPHSLTLTRKTRDKPPCDKCGKPYTGLSFHCEVCNFNFDKLCALLSNFKPPQLADFLRAFGPSKRGQRFKTS